MDIQKILTEYTAPAIILAVISMAIVGIVKIFTKMIPDEQSKVRQVMSYIYFILSAGASFGCVVLYFIWYKHVAPSALVWKDVLEWSASVYGCSQVLYPIYRDYGGRYILLHVLAIFKGKNAKTDEIIASIEKIMVLSDDQREKLKATIKEDID